MKKRKWIIYMHTVKTTNQSYIGQTMLNLYDRLHKHHTNACAGVDTYFYKAIRKYGIQDITSKILEECDDIEKSWELEKKYIFMYKTLAPNGYNLCAGGNGGDLFTVAPKELQERRRAKYRERSRGTNNSNYSGVTDQEIINKAIEYYINSPIFTYSRWSRYARSIDIPGGSCGGYPSFRFNGSSFKEEFKKQLIERNIYNESKFIYKKKNDLVCNKKISNSTKDRWWYTDNTKKYKLHFSDPIIVQKKLIKCGRLY